MKLSHVTIRKITTQRPGAMTSPLLRLFAVCWRPPVLGGAGFAILGTGIVWKDYHLLQK